MDLRTRRRALMAMQGGEPPYEHGTWEDLFRAIDAGTYATEYEVGELIPITLSNSTVDVQIVAFDTDIISNSTDKAPVTFISKKIWTKRRWNPDLVSNTLGTGTLGGWKESEIRGYCGTTLLGYFPSNIANRILSVKKYTMSYNASGSVVSNELSDDKVWLPSTNELVAAINQESSGVSYRSFFNSNSSRIKQYGTTNTKYYLRTPSNTTTASVVAATGAGNNSGVNRTDNGLVFGFCVG